MRKPLSLLGIIGLILIWPGGLLNLHSSIAQTNRETFEDQIRSNPSLREIIRNPEQFLGQTVTIEGYVIRINDTSESNLGGDLFITDSLVSSFGIWVSVSNEVAEIPELNDTFLKVMITGVIIFDPDPINQYRIEAQWVEFYPDPEPEPEPILPQPRMNFELYTDKIDYEFGDEVRLTFVNHEADSIVELPSGIPFDLEFHNPDSSAVTAFVVPGVTVLIPIASGEAKTWKLSELYDLWERPGYYVVTFRVLVNSELMTLITKFSVGMSAPVLRPHLELYTDKEAYQLGDEVVLIFVNLSPEDFQVQLPNGAPFVIEFHNLEGETTISALPADQVLLTIPPEEKMTWILRETQGLSASPGFYAILFQVYVNGEFMELYTKFMVGIPVDPPVSQQLEFFPNKVTYDLGEDVILTFVNQGPESVYFKGAETYFKGIDGSEARFPLPLEPLSNIPVGEKRVWTLSELNGLARSPGFYEVALDVHIEGEQRLETLYTRFAVGVEGNSSELFTNKRMYSNEEQIVLTFINKDVHGFSANAGYCLDITYRDPDTSSRLQLSLACIEILEIVPVGGNITWVLTPDQLNGPGEYLISYSFFRNEQKEIRQTRFLIEPDNIPTITTAPNTFTEEQERIDAPSTEVFFISGFGAVSSIVTLLTMLLVYRKRRT